MEDSPVNLNTSSEPVVPVIDSVPKIEPINPIPTPDIPSVNGNGPELNINSVKPASGIDSGFRVSNEPNIFDQPSTPFNISEEDVNKPLDVSVNNDVKEVSNNNKVDVNKQIELNERKIKLFTELANIYKEENDMLKNESEGNDNTASNLFNNNGTLDDLKILQG